MSVTRRCGVRRVAGGAVLAAAMTVVAVPVAAGATAPAVAMPSMWNSTTAGNTLSGCTPMTQTASAGVSAQVCFGELTVGGSSYVSGVLVVADASTGAPHTVRGTVLNVEKRGSRSQFGCLAQTIRPGQTLYCLTLGSWLGVPRATDTFTASGQATVDKVKGATMATSTTTFAAS